MATFRKYGGMQHSPISNIVRNNISNSSKQTFTTSGLANSKETFSSHVDMSGNSILHVGNIYFQDGSSINNGNSSNPTLSYVLSNGSSAGGNMMTDVGSITQTSSATNNLGSTVFNGGCSYLNSITPTEPNDLTSKSYVDAIASGINPTLLCNCATTENINLTSCPTTIDGVNLSLNYRVLVKSQGGSLNESTNNSENGIYVYDGLNLVRASDCSGGTDVTDQLTFISEGSLNGMKAFIQKNKPAFVGTSTLQYVPFYSLNYNLGQGLEMSGGSTLQVKSKLDFLTDVSVNNLTLKNINPLYSSYQTSLYQSGETCYIKNNTSNPTSGIGQFSFVCNNSGTTVPTYPLSIESSLFLVDVSRNGSATGVVKYTACNSSDLQNSGIPIGHNFTGTCYFNDPMDCKSVIQLGNKTSPTYNNPTSLGGIVDGLSFYQTHQSSTGSHTTYDQFMVISDQLSQWGSYILSFDVCVAHNSGGANTEYLKNLKCKLYSGGTTYASFNYKGLYLDITTVSGNFYDVCASFPVCKYVYNVSSTVVRCEMTIEPSGGNWYFGWKDVKFIRIS